MLLEFILTSRRQTDQRVAPAAPIISAISLFDRLNTLAFRGLGYGGPQALCLVLFIDTAEHGYGTEAHFLILDSACNF